jgi:hypothetical protein
MHQQRSSAELRLALNSIDRTLRDSSQSRGSPHCVSPDSRQHALFNMHCSTCTVQHALFNMHCSTCTAENTFQPQYACQGRLFKVPFLFTVPHNDSVWDPTTEGQVLVSYLSHRVIDCHLSHTTLSSPHHDQQAGGITYSITTYIKEFAQRTVKKSGTSFSLVTVVHTG